MSTPNPAYTSPSIFGSPITGDRVKQLSPDVIRKLWSKTFVIHDTTGDFFAEMEGASPMSLIQTKTETAAGAGQKITFTNASSFYAEPQVGEANFETSADFEELLTSSFDLQVDWFHHGIRHTQRTEEYWGIRGELAKLLDELFGEDESGATTVGKHGGWLGRLKTEALFMMYLNKLNSENLIGGTTPLAGLNWNTIVTYTQMMKRWGAPGAMVAKDPRGKPVRSYVIVACTDALTSLELDQGYMDVLKMTKDEVGAKYIFSGGYTPVRGHVIKEYEAIEHDGYGAIGSPLNPLARLGVAIANASTTGVTQDGTIPLKITGGGADYQVSSKLIKPTKHFPNYAYRFTPDDIISPAGTAFYVAIVNPDNAITDGGKYGFYKCTDNDGVGLKVTNALVDGSTVAAASGSAGGPTTATTLGNLTWDANKHSNTHAVGSLVVFTDANGKALFRTLILAASSAYRGYGKYRGKRDSDDIQGNFIRQVFTRTVFGQTPRKNRQGRIVGAIVLNHTGQYAGLPLPT